MRRLDRDAAAAVGGDMSRVKEWLGSGSCHQCSGGWQPGPGDHFEVVYRRGTRPRGEVLRCPRGHDVSVAVASLPPPPEAPADASPASIRRTRARFR